MDEILSLLKEYSPPVVLLLVVAGIVVYLLKLFIERGIEAGFNAHEKTLELALESKSAFKDKVLLERYTQIGNLSARLQKVLTNINRKHQGQPIPAGFEVGTEIVPLTEIYEDLEIHRLTLTEVFHDLFSEKAELVLNLANAAPHQWNDQALKLIPVDEKIRAATEEMFKLSEIKSY
jgi:hypothetical protein